MNNYKYLCAILALSFFVLGIGGCSVSENMDADNNNQAAWGLKEPKITRYDEASLSASPLSFRKAHQEWDHYNWSDTLLFSIHDKKSGNILLSTKVECSAGDLVLAPYTTNRTLNQDLPLYKTLSLEIIQAMDQNTPISCRFSFRAENQNGATHTFELERRNFLISQHTHPTQVRRIRNLSDAIHANANTIDYESLHTAQILYEQSMTTTVQMLCGSYLSPVLLRMNAENVAQLYKEEVFASYSLNDDKCRILGFDKNNLLTEMSAPIYVRNPFPFPKIFTHAPARDLVVSKDAMQIGLGPFVIENLSTENFLFELLDENSMNIKAELILLNTNNLRSYAHKVPIRLLVNRPNKLGAVSFKKTAEFNGSYIIPVRAQSNTGFQITATIRQVSCSGPYRIEGVRVYGGAIDKSLPYRLHLDRRTNSPSFVAEGLLTERIDIWAGIKNEYAKNNKPLVPKKIHGQIENKCR